MTTKAIASPKSNSSADFATIAVARLHHMFGVMSQALIGAHECFPPDNHQPLQFAGTVVLPAHHAPLSSFYECPECGQHWQPCDLEPTKRQA
jgi:hypothetical protein